jgi:hypothetical protein
MLHPWLCEPQQTSSGSGVEDTAAVLVTRWSRQVSIQTHRADGYDEHFCLNRRFAIEHPPLCVAAGQEGKCGIRFSAFSCTPKPPSLTNTWPRERVVEQEVPILRSIDWLIFVNITPSTAIDLHPIRNPSFSWKVAGELNDGMPCPWLFQSQQLGLDRGGSDGTAACILFSGLIRCLFCNSRCLF